MSIFNGLLVTILFTYRTRALKLIVVIPFAVGNFHNN